MVEKPEAKWMLLPVKERRRTSHMTINSSTVASRLPPTEPIPCDEVYMEDINEDEDSDSISSTSTDSHITRDGGHG
jgi:hypothetical protein